jgi:hypothetical protein
MKSFQIVTLFALFASAMAFSPNQLPQGTSCFVDTDTNVGYFDSMNGKIT